WSSDLCSSDLPDVPNARQRIFPWNSGTGSDDDHQFWSFVFHFEEDDIWPSCLCSWRERRGIDPVWDQCGPHQNLCLFLAWPVGSIGFLDLDIAPEFGSADRR